VSTGARGTGQAGAEEDAVRAEVTRALEAVPPDDPEVGWFGDDADPTDVTRAVVERMQAFDRTQSIYRSGDALPSG